MSTKNSNILLFRNSEALDRAVRLVKSKKKEDALLKSHQIPFGGITVIVSYDNVRYVKVTDGDRKFSELPKLGEGGGGSSDASTLNGQPGTYYRNRANHTGTQGINTISGLQSALNDKADASALSGYVPTTRTVNGKALSANVTLTNTDVGAAATSHTHAAGDVTSGTFADARIPTLAISKISGLQTELNGKAPIGEIVAVSSSRALALTDAYDYLNVTTASTLTVPTNASVAFPVGTVIQGFGQGVDVTFSASGGVTIHSKDNNLIAEANTAWSLKKVATDTWHLIGSLTSA